MAGLVGGLELRTQGAAAPAAQAPAPIAPPDTAALRAQYEKWRTEFKTWGKFAPLGQESKGTTSLITPQKVASAMRLVRNGIVVSLAHAEPQTVAADVGAAGVFHRVTNAITDGGTTDNYQVSYHGQTIAHIDSWCHFFENGQMYNGVPVKDNVTNESGCIKGSIMNWKDGITTRAVLYDIAALKGVDWVDPNVPITRADLEAWEKKSGVKIGPGDIRCCTPADGPPPPPPPRTRPIPPYYPPRFSWLPSLLPSFPPHPLTTPGGQRPRNPAPPPAQRGVNVGPKTGGSARARGGGPPTGSFCFCSRPAGGRGGPARHRANSIPAHGHDGPQ